MIEIIEYINALCKEHNCDIIIWFTPDGSMAIDVNGLNRDYMAIRADWSEETIKDCIKSVIKRACKESEGFKYDKC